MDGVFNIIEGAELWQGWFHMVGAAVELVALDQENVSSAVGGFPPFPMKVIVDLETDVPGDPHVAAKALALMSIEVQVRKLDQIALGFGNWGGEDEGVVPIISEVTVGPVQSRVIIASLVQMGEAGFQLGSNVGLQRVPDVRKMCSRGLCCCPGGFCHYGVQMPSGTKNFDDPFRRNKTFVQVEDASDD